MKINGQPVTAREFAWDGCHKIYLINSEEDRQELTGCGYDRSDIYPIVTLPEIWGRSCNLRFISNADLRPVVEQFEQAAFADL